MKKKGMSSHQSTPQAGKINDEWLTPPWIIEALGLLDLDPCTPDRMPWQTAKVRYCRSEDGLTKPWFGNIWLNPPYSCIKTWMKKISDYGNGIALIFARTETEFFFDYVWPKADAILFVKGRIYFHYPDGSKAKANGGAPSVLVAYGPENADLLQKAKIPGKFIRLKQTA